MSLEELLDRLWAASDALYWLTCSVEGFQGPPPLNEAVATHEAFCDWAEAPRIPNEILAGQAQMDGACAYMARVAAGLEMGRPTSPEAGRPWWYRT